MLNHSSRCALVADTARLRRSLSLAKDRERSHISNVERLNAALLSEAIYSTHPHELLQEHDWCSIDGLACSAIQVNSSLLFGIATDEKRNTVYLVIRGTVDANNWSCNLSIPHVYSTSITYGAVHKGFLSYAEQLPLDELLEEHDREGRRIVLCGHSMGGAVASVATAILFKKCSYRKSDLVCCTFGAPLFACADFADQLKAKGAIPIMEHWIHPNDVVPRLLSTPSKVIHDFLTMEATMAIDAFMNPIHGLPSIVKGLTTDMLLHQLKTLLPAYVPVGTVYDIAASTKSRFLRIRDDDWSPIGFYELSRFDRIHQKHHMSNYLALLKDTVGVVRQTEVVDPSADVPAFEDRRVDDIATHWRPSYSDMHRTGFEESGIRLELFGKRFGMLLPLTDMDVAAVVLNNGRPVATSAPLLITKSANVVSYSIPLSEEQSIMEEMELQINFRCPMVRTVKVISFKVSTYWFQDRETKIATGSLVDLLAHVRAVALVADPQNNRGRSFDATQHSSTTTTGGSTSMSGTAANEHQRSAVIKLDTFLASRYMRARDADDLSRISSAIHDLPDQRMSLINQLTLEMISSIANGETVDLKAFLKARVAKFKMFAMNGGGSSATDAKIFDDFKLPKASNVLSTTMTATRITVEIYLFEAVTTYIILNRWRELLESVTSKKMENSRSNAMKIMLTGIASTCVAAALVVTLGPGSVATYAAVQAFLTELSIYGGAAAVFGSVGVGATGYGGLAFLLTFITKNGGSLLHASSALTEKFVLGTLTKTVEGECSLQDHEDRCMQWIHSANSQAEWDDKVCTDQLRGIDEEARDDLKSFALGYIEPIQTLRRDLLQSRTFTIAIMGEPGSGKTTFLSNAYRTTYQERTAVQQSHIMNVKDKSGAMTSVHFLDFPGMNGNDEFAGSDVDNLTAILPAIDCILFFTKLNSRCFLAEELLGKVRGSCKVRIVLTHVDTLLQNKYCALLDEVVEDEQIDEEDVDGAEILKQSVDALIQDKQKFEEQLAVAKNEAVLWVPTRSLQLLRPDFKTALKPLNLSITEMKDWISSLVY